MARAERAARLAVRAACRAALHAGHERAGAAPGAGISRNCHRGNRGLIGRQWLRPIAAAVFVLLCSVAQWISFTISSSKQCSADTFSGLLLPALALWALEPEEDGPHARRIVAWWLAAAAAQWFSNGALLVAPACVLVMIVVLLHRNGWRAASQFAVLGVSWLASFGLNYALALRHALTNSTSRSTGRSPWRPHPKTQLGDCSGLRLNWDRSHPSRAAPNCGCSLAGGGRRDPIDGPLPVQHSP